MSDVHRAKLKDKPGVHNGLITFEVAVRKICHLVFAAEFQGNAGHCHATILPNTEHQNNKQNNKNQQQTNKKLLKKHTQKQQQQQQQNKQTNNNNNKPIQKPLSILHLIFHHSTVV